ncbi:MAG TPA: hypothetical protein VKR06_24550 [Ktedonosporobacter sp.]|nr:hypothetical protein [Ktedonosporobacter sp.]
MASAVKEGQAERIEIVDQPEESTEQGRSKSWLIIPLVLLLGAIGMFVVVRRFFKDEEE